MIKDYSVIIPTKDQSIYLEDSINSVLNQTISPREIILINDNSEDDTLQKSEIIFKNRNFKNFKILNNQVSLGPAKSRNIGIMNNKSEFVAFLDSDDYWEKTKIEEQFKKFEKPNFLNLGIVYTSHNFLINNKIRSNFNNSQIAKYRGYLFYKLLTGNYVSGSCSSVLCKKEVFEICGNFSENKEDFYIEDWELWTRIAKKFNFDFVDKKLLTIRIHNKNRSSTTSYDIDKALIKTFTQNKENRVLTKQALKILDDEIFSYNIKSIFFDDFRGKNWMGVTRSAILLSWKYFKTFQFKQLILFFKVSIKIFIKKIINKFFN